MTITTVNWLGRAVPRAPRLAPAPAAVALALLALSPACRADWKFIPQFSLSETYSDNIALRPVAQENWVTTLSPAFSLDNKGPRLDLHATYSKQFYEYADKAVGGTQHGTQNLSAEAKGKLIEELLFVDATANISQQNVSIFGALSPTAGNSFATDNFVEVKTARVSPYFKHRFGPYANAELRYAYDRVTSSKSGLNNSTGDTYSLSINSGTAFRQLGWGLQASKSKQQGLATTAVGGSSTSENASANLRWLASAQFNLTAQAGYDSFDYQALGGRNSGAAWEVGMEWQPSTRTHVKASAGRHFYGNSYLLEAQYRARASIWTLNYNDAVTSTRQQFLLPSTIDTFTTLDRMFSSTIADPVARRQVVEAYIQAAGLPSSLANNINYFSNRYFLQKQFQAALVMNGAHATTVLTLQDMRRNALSSAVVDSNLLGSSLSQLNENTSQTGANATLTWRLTSRDGLRATADVSRMRSLSAHTSNLNRSIRVGLTRQLQPKLSAAIDLRRIKGGLGIAQYTENAVSATLNKQF
ncbi:hypothetical protein GCM10027277_31710 [Pseudoduganella ginsengisoli]|uniref:TIGR03016 family PEP-CTERM system-associated outer membrane protein n=1 Tax=Pseudoduganella ginsengisoli TaxID=1462440 RepID=A0A6L6Q0M1_9BURK|nr:TIGR03016 family PEP-CTERM system-associated outer membrane protein [Pseudoduganella ginsengisoli]MTW02582.1 TIGR03016 family PEP-CTERM system-associated outer membrane protein [Pseudoduganella ginsengisoli]